MNRRGTSIRMITLLVCLLCAWKIAAAEDKPVCAGEESRQFDFWIGEWEVVSNDSVAGHNSIRPILDGCVLQERWSGAKGSGESGGSCGSGEAARQCRRDGAPTLGGDRIEIGRMANRVRRPLQETIQLIASDYLF